MAKLNVQQPLLQYETIQYNRNLIFVLRYSRFTHNYKTLSHDKTFIQSQKKKKHFSKFRFRFIFCVTCHMIKADVLLKKKILIMNVENSCVACYFCRNHDFFVLKLQTVDQKNKQKIDTVIISSPSCCYCLNFFCGT